MRLTLKKKTNRTESDGALARRNTTPKPHATGFSIVEVLVSAVILSIAIMAIVAVVWRGGDLQTSGTQRQAARLFLASRFEDIIDTSDYQSITSRPSTNHIFGDTTGGRGYTGTLYTYVQTDVTPEQVPVKKVTLSLAWFDIDSTRDSIALTKWIPE